MSLVDELESLRTRTESMTRAHRKAQGVHRELEREMEEKLQHSQLDAEHRVKDLLAQLDQAEATRYDLEMAAKDERQSRFSSEASRRQAERAAKRAKAALNELRGEMTTLKGKLTSLQTRLEKAERSRRLAVQAARDGKEALAMAKEEGEKKLLAKDADIKRMQSTKQREATAMATEMKRLRAEIQNLEARIDADRITFQQERSKWTVLEEERDTARSNLQTEQEIAARCLSEKDAALENLGMVRDQLAEERLRRLETEKQVAETTAARVAAETAKVNAEKKLREVATELRSVKTALEGRGISLSFLLGSKSTLPAATNSPTVNQHVTPTVARKTSLSETPRSEALSPPNRSPVTAGPNAASPSERLFPLEDENSSTDVVPSAAVNMPLAGKSSPKNSDLRTSALRRLNHTKLDESVLLSTDSEGTDCNSSLVSVTASLSLHGKPERGASAAMWAVRVPKTNVNGPASNHSHRQTMSKENNVTSDRNDTRPTTAPDDVKNSRKKGKKSAQCSKLQQQREERAAAALRRRWQ